MGKWSVYVSFVVRGESQGCRLFGTASMLEWLRNALPHHYMGAVRKDGAEIPREWSLPESESVLRPHGFLNVPLYFK